MLTVLDDHGKTYRLHDRLASGGEATIYRLDQPARMLAKIYKTPHPDYLFKLQAMIAAPPEDASAHLNHRSIAWPVAVLYHPDRSLAGYLMPFIENAVPLVHVFNKKLRQKKLPDFDERYLHRAARNLAAAVAAIHYKDYVIGDLNESNLLVKADTLITIIDTDSFQVRAPNRHGQVSTYPCPVGKPEYTAPEYQGKRFNRTRRTEESDNFALGVLLYQLLMDGAHPFRARWTQAGEPPPIEVRIEKGWFPHHRSLGSPVAPPENTLPLNTLHPGLQALVRQCFVDGHKHPEKRPTADEWEEAIATAEKDLIPCGKGHFYSSHQIRCPRCKLQDQFQSAARQAEMASQSQPGLSRKSPPAIRRPAISLTQPSPPAPAPTGLPPVPGYGGPAGIQPARKPASWGIFTLPIKARFSRIDPLAWRIGLGSLAGAVIGGIAGGLVEISTGAAITGGLGGLILGIILSSIIQRTIGWTYAAAGILGVAAAGLAFFSGLSPLTSLLAGTLGLVIGALLGRFGKLQGWQIVMILAMVALGGILGNQAGKVLPPGWLGSSLLGLGMGAACGALLHALRKI